MNVQSEVLVSLTLYGTLVLMLTSRAACWYVKDLLTPPYSNVITSPSLSWVRVLPSVAENKVPSDSTLNIDL